MKALHMEPVKTDETEPAFERDPLCKALFESLPTEVRSSFTEPQIDALSTALIRIGRRRHSIDIRTEISLFFARYYVVLLAGPDRRTRVLSVVADRRRPGIVDNRGNPPEEAAPDVVTPGSQHVVERQRLLRGDRHPLTVDRKSVV